MISLDLLIVTRRFWPHCGLTELALVELAKNLMDAGHRVTVATFRWDKSWAESVSLHQIPIVRFTKPVTGPWSSFRYSRVLSRHFTSQSYDGVIVSGIGDEALGVTSSLDELTPILLHVDASYVGVNGQLHRRHVETCLAADKVIATSENVRSLLSSVEEMPPIEKIHPGIRDEGIRFEKTKIRAALSKAHPVLRIDPDQPLVVSCTRMDSDDRILNLVAAWPSVLRQFPSAKLWLLGEGQNTNQIWQSIVEKDLAYSILFPGFFDDLNEIFAAADLYVHTAGPQQCIEGLVRAQSSGLPCIAVKNRSSSQLIEHEVSGWLTSDRNPQQLANSVIHLLSNRKLAEKIGQSSRNWVVDQFSPSIQANKYAELIRSLSNQLVEVTK